MKNLKAYKALIIIAMVFCSNNIFAQSNKDEVPSVVLAAFTTKYPKAEIKKWATNNNEYTAKGIEGRHKFYAAFGKNSVWIKTTSKINWSWNLPSEIRASMKENGYASWRIDKLEKVETPTGDFYQVMVDNLFKQIDSDHAGFAENLVLKFKPNGELFDKKSLNTTVLL